MKRVILLVAAVCIGSVFAGTVVAQKGAKRLGKVCGDPTAVCKAASNFQPNELPFDTGRNGVIADSERFYAVVLSSAKTAGDEGCEALFPEAERLKIQEIFPSSKVFADRCGNPASNYYKNFAVGTAFVAVFAGRTKAEAAKVLATVKATGKFADAYIKYTQVGINGT